MVKVFHIGGLLQALFFNLSALTERTFAVRTRSNCEIKFS
jgi:hypothetical protein